MSRTEPAHILMVYPPVAAPSAPPLQMVWLAGQFAIQGLPIKPHDANIDFFANYLLDQENLRRFLAEIEDKQARGIYRSVDPNTRGLLEDLSEHRQQWERRIARVGQYLAIYRGESFYRPENCTRAFGNTQALLKMASLAFYPSRVGWGTFDHPMAGDPDGPISIAQNASANPFRGFFKTGLAPKLGAPGLRLLLFWISSRAQLPAAATMAVFSRKANPNLPVAVMGASVDLAGCERFADNLMDAADAKLISRLRRFVGVKDTGGATAGPDCSHFPSGLYLAPATVPSFDLRAGRNHPDTTAGLFKTIDAWTEKPGPRGLLLTVDGDLPPYFYRKGHAALEESVAGGLGICTRLCEAFREIDGGALYKAGVRIIVWQAEGGSLETLKAVLWQISRAGIWNHLKFFAGECEALTAALCQFSAANPNIVHSWDTARSPGTSGDNSNGQDGSAVYGRVRKLPGRPLWHMLNDPEHLLLYLKRYGREKVMRWRVPDNGGDVYTLGGNLAYHFKTPENLPPGYLDEICLMVEAGGSVNMDRVRYNLERAFLVAYAMEAGVIVGNSSLKNPRPEYIEAVNRQSGLDLTHYVERGYTSVRPEYRGMGIGARLLAGLTKRAGDRKVFSVISADNAAARKMAVRNQTRQVAEYYSPRLGKRVGVWIPEWMLD